jgi:Tfp pilus assembly protein PilO
MKKADKSDWAVAVLVGLSFTFLAVSLALLFAVASKPGKIRALHQEIQALQERLITAQITTQELVQVQTLIKKNLAYSASDSLAQGASVTFLNDLTQVLDKLNIELLALEPQETVSRAGYVETPYKMEIICSFENFAKLLNKMEKSPRLITVREFEVKNSIEAYFNTDKKTLSQCRIRLLLTALTLVKGDV